MSIGVEVGGAKRVKMSTPAPAKVYGPPLSTAVSRVLACLLEKHVRFQVINVDLLKREHKSPQYIKLQVILSSALCMRVSSGMFG